MEKTCRRRRAVLFVHGFMGTPRQFDPIAQSLEDTGADLHRLVLPGHERNIEDFAGEDAAAWQQTVDDALDRLRANYDDLILVGHSMGGLLLIRAAVRCPDRIREIIAVSLPLSLKLTFRGIRIRLGSMGRAPKDPDARAAKEMCGVSGVTFRNSWRLLPNALGLLRVMGETGGNLPGLTVPLTVINSRRDEIVSMRTLDLVKKKDPRAELLTLERASHFRFPEEETELIAARIRTALDRCRN